MKNIFLVFSIFLFSITFATEKSIEIGYDGQYEDFWNYDYISNTERCFKKEVLTPIIPTLSDCYIADEKIQEEQEEQEELFSTNAENKENFL